MKLLRLLITFIVISGPLAAGPVFFRECCCRQPCSYITWRGACCVPSYNLYADFLYWQVHPDGLDFARDGGIAALPTTDVEQGKILNPGCRANPGVRIGLKVDLGPCCTWDVFGQYTYLNNNFRKTSSKGLGVEGLRPLVWNLGVGGSEDINLAEGRWKHEISILDIGLGNTFCVDSCFSFRPHLGLKTTWQKLRYRVKYENIVNATTTSQDQICFVTDFNGIGLRGGMESQYKLFRCLSFVGNFAFSAMYSDLNTNRQDDHIDNINSGTSPIIANTWFNREHCTLIPVTEILVGLQWDIPMMCDYEYHIMIGWEAQVWWNMMQYIFVNNNSGGNAYEFGARGNISYQGLTARLSASF